MSAMSSLQLGFELQKLSDSATWKHYVALHPRAKVGFHHHGEVFYFTLIDRALGHRGIIKYSETITGLIELAHLALWEEGEIEVQ